MLKENKIAVTILVCDDDADGRALTEHALRDARLTNDIRFVEDGEQLLDYLFQRGAFSGARGLAPRPGLILLDLNMPKFDGRDVLKVIKDDAALRDIPVIVLTTSRFDEDIVRRQQLGINSFMTKPVTLSGLAEAMRDHGRYWLEIVEVPPSGA